MVVNYFFENVKCGEYFSKWNS